MKHYNVTIVSKNKKALNTFVSFFVSNLNLNFNTINKYFEKKTKRKVLTILKSPHVNKKAQEQFESKLFSKQLTLYLPNHYQCLVFLKKIKTIFAEVKIKIKFIHNKNLIDKKQVYVFNTRNFELNLFSNNRNCNNRLLRQNRIENYEAKKELTLKRVERYIKIADICGELHTHPRLK